MTLDEAKKSQRDAYDRLFANSTPVHGEISENLAAVKGVIVEVRRVPASEILAVTGQVANGTPMHYDGRYVIFLGDALSYPSPYVPSLSAPWLDRLCVLHEYGHIIAGDVFQDDPDRFYRLYQDNAKGCPVAAAEIAEMELRADKHAFPRLLDEAKNAGDSPLTSELEDEINARGLNS